MSAETSPAVGDTVLALSVVICSRNGSARVTRALRSVLNQTTPSNTFEVLVVDDGSNDSTAAVASRAGARVVRLEERRGIGAARNAGIAATTASLIAFTDDDCEVDRHWVASIVRAFADSDVDGISGRVIPEATNELVRGYLRLHNPLRPLDGRLLRSAAWTYRLRLYLRRSIFPRELPGPGLYSVVGANMAFRRTTLTSINGFDDSFDFGGEEEELCMRLRARPQGVTLRYADDVVVTHWFFGGVIGLLRRARGYGRGNARIGVKHGNVRPIVFPAPVVAALLACGSLWLKPPLKQRMRAAGLLIPIATYPSWVVEALRVGSIAPALYPYLQLAQEIGTMAGQVETLWQLRRSPRG